MFVGFANQTARGGDDEGFPTLTSEMQQEVEDSICKIYAHYDKFQLESVALDRDGNINYIMDALLNGLPRGYTGNDGGKPWIYFWSLAALHCLGVTTDATHSSTSASNKELLTDELLDRIAASVLYCQNKDGGFGGGPETLAHLVTTYAAVHALAMVGTERALSGINRPALYKWMMSLKQPDGSFRVHHGGEIDIRASYCVVTVASLLNMITDELVRGIGDYVTLCQTYEGGIGCIPGVEAHGGYAFCALGALVLLGETDKIEVTALLRWAAARQFYLEGGFNGRPNKLVDGCYAHWVGGLFPIIEAVLNNGNADDESLYDKLSLQKYLLLCCQKQRKPGVMNGGMRDKPGKGVDLYHTCYCLCGLSESQNTLQVKRSDNGTLSWTFEQSSQSTVAGVEENRLLPVHPVHTIGLGHVTATIDYFSKQPLQLV
ncbi:GI22551 [Ramicandelaber brevisporus]|nr:GI22551 [Ramicandelaber brevisporus]